MSQNPPLKSNLRLVHSEASRGWGGQEIRVFTELKAMRARGHTVALIAPSNSRIYAAANAVGIETIKLYDQKWLYPLTLLWLSCWMIYWKPHIVNTHSSRDGWLVGIATRLAKRKLIRSRHIEVDYPNRYFSQIAFGSLPHFVLTTSDKISTRLIKELSLNANNVACVPTGIDLNRFHPNVSRSLREDFDVPPRTALIGMVSVLRSWKGHDVFLEAIEILKRKRVDARFWIVGGGPGFQRLSDEIIKRDLIKNVALLGHREDVPEILAALDILVLPSLAHEGIPQIILQAQAMGKAVVGTSIGGIPEVVVDQVTGILIPPKDPQTLATVLEKLISSPEERSRLGKAAEHKAFQFYGLDTLCERIENIYKKVLELN